MILLKRGLEEYSHTDAGALYAIQGCPVNESPLHLVPHSLRANFRATYGVEIAGEPCPHCVARTADQVGGDFHHMFPGSRRTGEADFADARVFENRLADDLRSRRAR